MGTNFYMYTKDKRIKDFAPFTYKIVDRPDFGYEIHIGKTSAGWVPLFMEHHQIKSIRDYKRLYNLFPDSAIYDENGDKYTWPEFTERVLQFNNGTKDVKDIKEFDEENFDYIYHKDLDGYQFSRWEFS